MLRQLIGEPLKRPAPEELVPVQCDRNEPRSVSANGRCIAHPQRALVPFGIDLDGRHLVLAAALQGVVERHRVEASGGRSRGGER